MNWKLIIPFALIGALLVAPAADAKKPPSDRARIRHLELVVKHLKHDLKEERASLSDAYELALAAQENATQALQLWECVRPIEINELVFTLPGADTPTLSMTFGVAGKKPDFYLAEIASNCVENGQLGIPAG